MKVPGVPAKTHEWTKSEAKNRIMVIMNLQTIEIIKHRIETEMDGASCHS